MKLFNTLCLEINSLCNRRCVFCPVAYNHRPEARMELNMFRAILWELNSLKYKGRIELYIYNEPCRDWEWLLECVSLARAMVPRACLMIATNGDYLRGPERIKQLYDEGLNQLLINCYSPGLFEKRAPWMEPFKEYAYGETYNYISPGKRSIEMLDKSNPATFGTGIFRIVNRAGNIQPFMPAATAPLERMCVKPWRLLNINWLGQALVCCMDYHGTNSYASFDGEHTLVQLWNHPVMNTYRKHLYKKDRSLPMCNKCDCHAGAYAHMVQKPEGPYAKI